MTFENKYQNFQHRMSQAFPLSQSYVPSAKEANSFLSQQWARRANEIMNPPQVQEPPDQQEQRFAPQQNEVVNPVKPVLSPLEQEYEMKKKRLYEMGLL